MQLNCLVFHDIPEKSFTAKDAHQLKIWVKLHKIDVQQSNHIIVLGVIHWGEINGGAKPFWFSLSVMAKTAFLRHYVLA